MDQIDQRIEDLNRTRRSNVNIEICLTNSCNHNCKYCFEIDHIGRRNLEEEKRQINLLKETCRIFDISRYQTLEIVFWGGEPMLNLDFMLEIIGETGKFPFVRYYMYTNGTIRDGFERLFSSGEFKNVKDRFNLQVSFDGEPIHSEMRGYSGKSVIQMAEFIRENGISPGFKATLPFSHIEMLPSAWESYRDLQKIFPDISYNPTLDQTNNIDNTSYGKWKTAVIDIARKERSFINEHGRPLLKWFDDNGRVYCEIGNSIHVETDGRVYMCHGCPHTPNRDSFVLGSTSECTSFMDFMREDRKNYELPYDCITCGATHCTTCHVMCLGDCKNISEVEHNWCGQKTLNPERCRFFKFFGKVDRVLRLSTIQSMGK